MKLLLALLAAARPALAAPQGPAAPPPDFELVAHYYAGFSDWQSWEVRVSSDGSVHDVTADWYSKELARAKTEKEKERPLERLASRRKQVPARLDSRRLEHLYRTIGRVDFMSLPEHLQPEHEITDKPTLFVSVQASGRSHQCAVYAWDKAGPRKDVRRFTALWREILELFPSPNPGQTASLYR